MHLVDLPGTYSLTANSQEEVIARDYILKEKPDVVLAVLNAASLERNLYLVAELLALAAPVGGCPEHGGRGGRRGRPHRAPGPEAALGVPVVPMIATKNQGVRELVATVDRLARGEVPYQPHVPEIREDHREVLAQLQP